MSSAHRLVVVRHAKADQAGPSDFERPLTERGHADAAAAGRWLRDQAITADLGLVSAALRTRETWQDLARAAGWELDPTLDEGLYAAGSDTVLDLLRQQDDSLGTVVVVGHNPTMSYLAQMFDDGECEPALASALVSGFPTSAVAVFTHDGSWADLAVGCARLVAFEVGRDG